MVAFWFEFVLLSIYAKDVGLIFRKACGLDHIHRETLKAGGKDVILFMTKLSNTFFLKGIYPSDWAKAITVPIHKKGDIHLVDNYRGVSLLSIVIHQFRILDCLTG